VGAVYKCEGLKLVNIWNSGTEYMEQWHRIYGTVAQNIWNSGTEYMEQWHRIYGTVAQNHAKIVACNLGSNKF